MLFAFRILHNRLEPYSLSANSVSGDIGDRHRLIRKRAKTACSALTATRAGWSKPLVSGAKTTADNQGNRRVLVPLVTCSCRKAAELLSMGLPLWHSLRGVDRNALYGI